jgi:hypothetical protein
LRVARDERARWNGFDDHERRAALARRTFALELDRAVTTTQRSTRKLVPVLYGLAAFGALLAVVAVVRLTRKPVPALVRVTLPPPPAPASPGFLQTLMRAPLDRGTLLAFARFALQRFAAMERRSLRGLLPALSSVAASSLTGLEQERERQLRARARGELRQP